MANAVTLLQFAKSHGMFFDEVTCTNHTDNSKFKSLRFRQKDSDKEGTLVGFPKDWTGPTDHEEILANRKKYAFFTSSATGKHYIVKANVPIDLSTLDDDE